MNVGTEIRRAREAKGWSQAKLAGASDMGVSGISQIETGSRNPSVVTLTKIAEALGLEVAELFPKGQASLPDFGDERREYTADELLEDFRRQVKVDAKARRRLEASEGVTQTYFANHYNAAVEKLSERLPANLVGPIADILQGFARQEQEIARLEAELKRAAERNDRTAQTA
jgi:transcriptional regulator with XRE-family HTH domain